MKVGCVYRLATGITLGRGGCWASSASEIAEQRKCNPSANWLLPMCYRALTSIPLLQLGATCKPNAQGRLRMKPLTLSAGK